MASVAIGGVFTLLLAECSWGLTSTAIMDQSRQRAELIEELERTRGKLAELSREAGALAERERLAGEIHDALAQGFTSVIMLVEGGASRPGPGRSQLSLGRSSGCAKRRLATGFRGALALIGTLGAGGVAGGFASRALLPSVRGRRSRFGLAARFVVDGEPTRSPITQR